MTPMIITATEGLLPNCKCGAAVAIERNGNLFRVVCVECSLSSFWQRRVDDAARDWKRMLRGENV